MTYAWMLPRKIAAEKRNDQWACYPVLSNDKPSDWPSFFSQRRPIDDVVKPITKQTAGQIITTSTNDLNIDDG